MEPQSRRRKDAAAASPTAGTGPGQEENGQQLPPLPPESPWLWLASLCSQLVEADVSTDIKVLSEITISRLQQFPELNLKVSGLEFIPEQQPALSLGAIDRALERFQQVLPQLASQAPAAQVSNDVENMRSLLQRLASDLGCALDTPSSEGDLSGLQDRLADSYFTVVSVTFHRLRELLRFIEGHVDEVRSC